MFTRSRVDGTQVTDAQVLREAAALIEEGRIPDRSGDRVGAAVASVLAGDASYRRRLDVRAVVRILAAHNRDYAVMVYEPEVLVVRMRATARLLETHDGAYEPFAPPAELILGEVDDEDENGCE